jgi:hypothetical protein
MGCRPATQNVTEHVAIRFEIFCAEHPSIALPWSANLTVPVGAGGAGVVLGTATVAVMVVRCPCLACRATRSATEVWVDPDAAVACGPAA